jgi:hypothetical protein
MSYEQHQHLEGYGVGFAEGRDYARRSESFCLGWCYGVAFGVAFGLVVSLWSTVQ